MQNLTSIIKPFKENTEVFGYEVTVGSNFYRVRARPENSDNKLGGINEMPRELTNGAYIIEGTDDRNPDPAYVELQRVEDRHQASNDVLDQAKVVAKRFTSSTEGN